jgi:hypothetical protein
MAFDRRVEEGGEPFSMVFQCRNCQVTFLGSANGADSGYAPNGESS